MSVYSYFFPTRKELTQKKPKSSGYRNPFAHNLTFHYQERPPFSLLTAELMQFDPKVTIALAVRNGLLMNAEVEVSEGRPEIMEFVASQWEAIWSGFCNKILEAKNCGYAGFEVMYQEAAIGSRWQGRLVFDRLKDFHPRDVRPLVRSSELIGLTLRNVRGLNKRDEIPGIVSTPGNGGGKIAIMSPKSLWVTYRMKYSNLFGLSILENAYAPWYEKTMRGGYIKLRQLRMIKDAWVGDVLKYPSNWSMPDGRGGQVTGRDLAREIGENRYSGGIVGIPSDMRGDGSPLFDYVTPTSVQGATGIFEYGEVLDTEIMEALEMPGEVLEALSSGSGFSGRAIPFVSLLAVLEREFVDYVSQINEQILKPLVRINFNVEPYYKIQPRPLIDIVTQMMKVGEGSSPGDGSSADPAASMFRMNRPMGGSPQTPRSAFERSAFARQFSDSLPGAGYRQNRRLAHVLHSTARYTGPSFPSPDGGLMVGGIWYEAGRQVPAEAIQFASDDERERFPDQQQPAATVGDQPRSRREMMRRLVAERISSS